MHVPSHFKQAMILHDKIIDDETLSRLLLKNDISGDEIVGKPKIVCDVSKEH